MHQRGRLKRDGEGGEYKLHLLQYYTKFINKINEGLPGVLGNKGNKGKYRGQQENMNLF